MDAIISENRKAVSIVDKETENRRLIKPEELIRKREKEGKKGKEKIDYHKKMVELRAKGKNDPAAEGPELNAPKN